MLSTGHREFPLISHFFGWEKNSESTNSQIDCVGAFQFPYFLFFHCCQPTSILTENELIGVLQYLSHLFSLSKKITNDNDDDDDDADDDDDDDDDDGDDDDDADDDHDDDDDGVE